MSDANKARFEAIDVEKLAKHFDSAEAEKRLDTYWQDLGIYRYNPDASRDDTFVVDTPPPTVSGSLHLGHVFSYSHTDIIARFQRMMGKNVFYPMGWDDNGLPTERRVQNVFHVRCDPNVPYDPHLTIDKATDADTKSPPRLVSRQNFIELCSRVTKEDEQAFMALFRRVALSVDWTQEYATIDAHCRTLAQRSFLDLWNKGHVYNVDAPTMWDIDFQTAVAQAEVEDREKDGAFHDIWFGVEGSTERFMISTTRPELLPACVAVTAHPSDERYKHLFGKRAVTPLFHAPVPVFPSELADPEKGTGILMVCTFGDATDVLWWREQKLPLRQILARDGKLRQVYFGSDADATGYVSLLPDVANAAYAELSGKTINAAQRQVVEMLKRPGGAPWLNEGEAALASPPKPLRRPVKYFEKGDRPLEFISTRQWFVRLMDKKQALIDKGEEIQWHPDFMRLRYRNWTENLQLDWCVSRQRYFGVPIPVWYPLDADGMPEYDKPIIAGEAELPVDPMARAPQGFDESQRDRPHGFTADRDVFDTWFTSSLTPQIGTHWELNPARHEKLFPTDIRPQSHEIIRTWAFYTIAKAMLHENKIPWRHVIISGWILDPDRKKMSKSKGNVVTPMHLLDDYGSDGVRYWAASARLGVDTAFDEKVLKVGKRLVTKIFNAGKFVLMQEGERHAITNELDRAFVSELHGLVKRATAAFHEFNFAQALLETESFFWSRYTDTYIELAKGRARGEGAGGATVSAADQGSAIATLRLGLSVLLRLFAPFLPYITEEVWQWSFAFETNKPSIHKAPWPTDMGFNVIADPQDSASFETAVQAMFAINKAKTAGGVSTGRAVSSLTLAAHPETAARLQLVTGDVMSAARVAAFSIASDASVEPGSFRVDAIEFVIDEPAATVN